MASHLQPFSPPQVQNTEIKFHVFPQLPKELRDRIWYNSIQHTQIFHLHLYDLDRTPPPTTDGDLGKAVRPAFGFWVFPIQVLGSLGGNWEFKVLWDLSTHWPELWLAKLPDKA